LIQVALEQVDADIQRTAIGLGDEKAIPFERSPCLDRVRARRVARCAIGAQARSLCATGGRKGADDAQREDEQ